jgi:hypothetical protein
MVEEQGNGPFAPRATSDWKYDGKGVFSMATVFMQETLDLLFRGGLLVDLIQKFLREQEYHWP